MNSTYTAFIDELRKNQKALSSFLLAIPSLAALEGIADAKENKSNLTGRVALYGGASIGAPSALLIAASALKHKRLPPAGSLALPPILGSIGAVLAGGAYSAAHHLTKGIPHATPE
jgi:hypothetical protein